MTRILVAGIGNVFFGDDAFGVEVAQLLAREPPAGTRVGDFGVRARHLAYELLSQFELCVVADCMPRGGAPGTLYMVEPDAARLDGSVADAHGMTLETVFAAVRELGAQLPRTLIVGCEPATVEPGMGLSEVVASAVPRAAAWIRELITSTQEATP